MSKKNDISTPEGYFGDLQQRLSAIPSQPVRVSPVRRMAPYFAYAASLLVAVLIGNAVFHRTPAAPEDDGWTYVSYLADALDPDGASFFDASGWDAEAEEGLSRDDIVEFLLADGISVEQLNYVSYEEGY